MSVPKLRFKNFQGDWKFRTLSDVIGSLDSGVSVNSLDVPISSSSDFGILKTSCISDGIFYPNENKQIIEEDLGRAKLNPIEDSILVSRMNTPQLVGEVGYISKNYKNLFVPDRLWLIGVRDRSANSTKWLSYQLTTQKFKYELSSIATGTSGSMKNIAQPNFLNLELFAPAFEEQTKIANFLTVVDEKITQLTQKCDLLAQYKKGVMQQIFSQELRFKYDDGRDFPEWESKVIGDITDKVIAGGTPSTLKKNYWNGNIRWMNSGELNLKRVFEVENRITESGLSNSSTKLIPPRCVLIGLAGQGKTRGTVAMNMIELCTNQSIASIYPKPEIFNEEFLYQNLDMRYDELRGLSTGDGGRGGLNLQIIKSVNIPLPSIQEQTKIANFITAIDDKINNAQAKLAAVKQYKQGLLQQMFV